MDPRFRVEVDKFNRAMREMQGRLKQTVTMEKIIDYEVSKIIEMALQKTKAATVSGIRASSESKEWTTYQGKKYKLSNRYPRALHLAIAAKRKASLMRKLAARGLSRNAWLTLARAIGFDISAPGFVAAARRPDGKGNEENVSASRNHKEAAYGLEIANNSPINRWSDARPAFFGAVVGRRKFYDQNLKRGVFSDLAKVAAKYPGLTVKE